MGCGRALRPRARLCAGAGGRFDRERGVGYREPIPAIFALPSQDGDYWIFYSQEDGLQSGVYCFFVPMEF